MNFERRRPDSEFSSERLRQSIHNLVESLKERFELQPAHNEAEEQRRSEVYKHIASALQLVERGDLESGYDFLTEISIEEEKHAQEQEKSLLRERIIREGRPVKFYGYSHAQEPHEDHDELLDTIYYMYDPGAGKVMLRAQVDPDDGYRSFLHTEPVEVTNELEQQLNLQHNPVDLLVVHDYDESGFQGDRFALKDGTIVAEFGTDYSEDHYPHTVEFIDIGRLNKEFFD